MAVSLLAHDVSELCLGKPPLRSLSVSATVGDALSALKRSAEPFLSVWSCHHHHHHHHHHRRNPPRSAAVVSGDVGECRCVGKVCLADVICFLAKDENLKRPSIALQEPVSVLVPIAVPGLVRHLEPHASLLEAIDAILDGAQNLVIPIHSPISRKRLIHKPSSNSILHNNSHEYCWLTQEDIIRYLLNAIGLFSPTSNYTIESLNIIDKEPIFAVHFDDPVSAALPLISLSLLKQTSIAVLDEESRLIGEISPVTLNSCDESAAAAIATLTAGDLMAYIDCDSPPEDLVRLVKKRLEERKLGAAVDLMDDEPGILWSPSSSSSSLSSSDEEFGLGRTSTGKLNGHSMRAFKNPTEPIVCSPSSSLVAVMIQALSHRVTYMWVVEDDGSLVGVVTFAGVMKVFRERLKSMV